MSRSSWSPVQPCSRTDLRFMANWAAFHRYRTVKWRGPPVMWPTSGTGTWLVCRSAARRDQPFNPNTNPGARGPGLPARDAQAAVTWLAGAAARKGKEEEAARRGRRGLDAAEMKTVGSGEKTRTRGWSMGTHGELSHLFVRACFAVYADGRRASRKFEGGNSTRR